MSDIERELVSLPSSGGGLYAIFLASAWFPFQKSAVSCGACTSSAVSQVSCASEYPVHLTRYWSCLERPKHLAPTICSTSHSGLPSMTSGGGFVVVWSVLLRFLIRGEECCMEDVMDLPLLWNAQLID